MGRKKYYCEYCDKSFNDDVNTRFKHLSSFRHIELREEHYNNFKDPALILKEESMKKPCSRFQNDGMCRFGVSCRYSHYRPEDFEHLQKLVESSCCEKELPQFSNWFHALVKNEDLSHIQLSYCADSYPYKLPPSLQPFDVMRYLTNELTFWGS